MTVLAADGLVKHYGDTVAIADVGFAVHEGRALGVIGESGSGKSTLARLLAGLEIPDVGTITLEGRPLVAKRARSDRKKIQIIFQDALAALNPRLSILQSIEDFISVHRLDGRRTRRRRAVDALETVHLSEEVGRRRPSELSGGQRQRACIARALSVAPTVLVADEPTSALDVSIQGQILNLLMELKHDRRLALVFISHDMGVVRYIADDILVMLDGRVIEHGARDQVIDAPQHAHTKALVAAAEEML